MASNKHLAYISGFANARWETFYVGINYESRGYEKIKKTFEKENLQISAFEQVRGGVLATIPREIFTTLNKQNVGDNVGDVSVIDQVNDRLTTNYIAQKLGLSYSTVQRVLRVLKR